MTLQPKAALFLNDLRMTLKILHAEPLMVVIFDENILIYGEKATVVSPPHPNPSFFKAIC